jgi:copper(I)-binding protein
MSRTTSRPPALLTALVLALGATACGSDAASPSAASTSTRSASSVTDHTAHAQALTLTDGWAKAGTGMTGLFGTLTNSTGEPITVMAAVSDAASRAELHIMARQADGSMKMVQKDGGFTVPAGGVVKLVPGGDHVMLIGLTSGLRNGDAVHLALTTTDGWSFEWTVPVRSFAGADEEYLPGASSTGMAH